MSIKSPGVTCTDLPQFRTAKESTEIALHDCSPRVLSCANHVLVEPFVREIAMYGTKEPLTSEDLKDFDEVTRLSMFQTDAGTVMHNMTAISTLRSLRLLEIHNGNLELYPHMFEQSPDLQSLFFRENNMTSLPEDVFNGLASLKILSIGDNNIGKISEGSFRGLDAVEVIQLYNNNITSIEVGAFSGTSNLRNFSLVLEALGSLPNGLLERLEQLESVIINDNKVDLSLGSKALSNLPALTAVVLASSGIRSLPENLFHGSSNILCIEILGNHITRLPSKIFSGLSSLRSLDLSNNSIQKIDEGVFNNIKTLQFLYLSDNNIEDLSESTFEGLSNLLVLNLKHNNIKQINLKSSLVPKKSHELSFLASRILNNNTGFQWSSDEFLKMQSTSPFHSLKQLNQLDLSHNQMRYFYKGWASDMPNIAVMDLSRNLLTDIRDFDTNYSSVAVVVDLQFNNIHYIPLDPRISLKNDTTPNKSYLILDNNPIACDCNAYGLYLRLNGIRLRHEPTYVIKRTSCISPNDLKGQLLKDVSPSYLICELNPIRNCSTFIFFIAATNEVIINCPKLPSSLPDPQYLNSMYDFYEEPNITLGLDTQPESIEGFTIHTLNVSNIGINTLAFRPSESLKILDISSNNITTIPDEFFKRRIILYLFNNSLECDCLFAKKLQEYGLVADYEKVTCANGDKVADINVHQLCNGGMALGAIIANSIIGSLFLLMIIRAVYKNKKDILTYILSNLCGRDPGYTETIEKRLDAAKQFDLFVSFAHQDEDFVTGSLLPKLENEFAQKVCVHSRDWVAGELIVDQIIRSVESSRRTIIVLTESFLLSEWSFFEFRTAHNLSIQEGRPRVIIILLDEDISKDDRLGPELKSYITINTYLLWGEPNFWEKLKKALPRRK